MPSSTNCVITMETIADEERYHRVVYQVIKHCPQVLQSSVDEATAKNVLKELGKVIAPHEATSSRRATPLKQPDNGARVVSADSFVKMMIIPTTQEERTEVRFRGFVLTETRHAVFLSKTVLPLTFPRESSEADVFLTIRRLSGGITNELFHVFGSAKDAIALSVVVRVFGKETDRVISRESELFYQSLFLRTFVHGRNFLIYEFLPQYEPIPYTDMPTHAAQIADSSARFQVVATLAAKKDDGHPLLPVTERTNSELSPTVEGFDSPDLCHTRFSQERNYTLHSLTRWADLVNSQEIVDKVVGEKQLEFRQVAKKLQVECVWMLAEVKKLSDQLAEGVCHNDLLCGNIMRHPETGDMKIIDFDYAHRNYLLFDAANHFNEYTGLECDYAKYFPNDDLIFEFVMNYRKSMRKHLTELSRDGEEVFVNQREIFWTIDEEEEKKVGRRWVDICKLLSLASHLSWGVWSLMQEAVSEIDVDFLDYSKKRFERYIETKSDFTAVWIS